MVKDQRRAAQPVLSRTLVGRPRGRTVSKVAITVIAFAVIVVPHFVSSSPTTNDDTDPTNGITHGVHAP